MKPRPQNTDKIDVPMAPMIDVVFQLLIFFMFTLNFVEQEGDFSINMPISGTPTQATDDKNLPELKVRITANPDGTLRQLTLGARPFVQGGDPDYEVAYARLNSAILQALGGRPGNPANKDIEVEIDADYNLQMQFTQKAISACSGRLQKDGDETRIVRYVEKIKFARPRRPAEG